MSIGGTSGNDNLTGTSGNDSFNLSQGGDDTVQGLGGKDLFAFGATFTAADSVDGGAGADTIRLTGDYSAGLVLGAATMTSVETIQLSAGNTYDLTTDDANVAAGATLTIDGSALGAGDRLFFNGANETDGQFTVEGGAGSDMVFGGTGNDQFDAGASGNDRIYGEGGDDTISLGAGLTAQDRIDGGAGSDTLVLAGDYFGSHALTMASATIRNVEDIRLTGGNSYDLTMDDGNLATGPKLTVDAHRLGASDRLIFDASAESTGTYTIDAGAGNDVIFAGSGLNSIDLRAGGNDIAIGGSPGGGGNDGTTIFNLGAAFTANDQIQGNSGDDTLELQGNYTGASALVFKTATLRGVETVSLAAGSYDIKTADSTVADFASMTIEANGHLLDFDGSAETNGFLTISRAGAGSVITGGGGADTILISASGTYNGGGGSDDFGISATSMTGIVIDGGSGSNSVDVLTAHALTFQAGSLLNIGTMNLRSDASVTLADAIVPAGGTLAVNIAGGPTRLYSFDGSAETDGHFSFVSVGGTDTIVGGALSDSFTQQFGSKNNIETLTGGGGADNFSVAISHFHFAYNAVSDSTSTNFDSITGLDFGRDGFHVSGIGAITAVDAEIFSGSLSPGTFDSDLSTAVNAGNLGAHHAVLFAPNAGSLSGEVFLVIDENGTAGYQAGGDLVIELTNVTNSNLISTANFT